VSSIRTRLFNAEELAARRVWSPSGSFALEDLRDGTALSVPVGELAGRSVLIAAREQLAAALAMIELDGVAKRMIICTPDVSADDLRVLINKGDVDAIVSDRSDDSPEGSVPLQVFCSGVIGGRSAPLPVEPIPTEWVLLTSGTTGSPKMVRHSFASLAAPIAAAAHQEADVVWATFYDIRRYGGLQVFFRFLLGRGSLVVGGSGEPPSQYLIRMGRHGVTHLTGTPSHWRRALMCPEVNQIAPRYVRLSGEIVDQGILNALRASFPEAAIGHAFASTEAGVGFEVNDGLEGFPASILDGHPSVEMKVQDGSLWIRSPRGAAGYLGEPAGALDGNGGFVDTGDLIERRGERYYFLGRRSGVINIGGNKVYPEEVEAAINCHPAVRMSMVRAKRSAITGALVVADVVLADHPDAPAITGAGAVRSEILQICRERLTRYKVPAMIRFVPVLDIAAAGKLARHAS
jgi:acyl-coenzyme A synthetase/AMP-(fatty) acid ligase